MHAYTDPTKTTDEIKRREYHRDEKNGESKYVKINQELCNDVGSYIS